MNIYIILRATSIFCSERSLVPTICWI